jgi:hypothetical protein
MEFNFAMPTSFDALHLSLGLSVLVMFVVALMRGSAKPALGVSERIPTETTVKPPAQSAPAATANLKTRDPESALQVLGLLQQEARFIDFLNEDLKAFSDAEIGAVARVVHEGSQKLLNQYFQIEPVRSEEEETQVTLQLGFNSAENRVTGNVVGEPPFTGTLLHRGWRVVKSDLPKLAEGHDPRIVAPAEVEL